MRRTRSISRRQRAQLAAIAALVAILLVLVFFGPALRRLLVRPAEVAPSTAATYASNGLPILAVKPVPQLVAFHDCPADGDNPHEIEQNRLKNRSDEAEHYYPVTFEAIVKLPWPPQTARRDRDNWSAADAREVARWEGIPIAIEGYLAAARLSGPESCNCHSSESDMRDFHVWLTGGPTENRSRSIVVEPTPRLRARHPSWTTMALNHLAKQRQRVRISGWLFFDPEHPDQIGKTRGTPWEIHPVTKIEVETALGWATLDELP